jgi:hypothetical protein
VYWSGLVEKGEIVEKVNPASILNIILKKDGLIIVSTFLIAFGWFAVHAVPSLYYGDNGELLAAVHSCGIPHPTGFPLFLLLCAYPAKLGTFAVNLTSSAAGALSVALTFILARRVLGKASSWFSTVILMSSCTLVLHAAMSRVYSFQLACLVSVMLIAVLFKPDKRWALMFGFLLGLSACTHMLFVCGIVFTAVYLFDKRRELFRLLPWMFPGIVLGGSLYLWLPLRAHLSPAINWSETSNWGNFWYFITQREFAQKMFSRNMAGTWVFIKALMGIFSTEWNPLVWVLFVWGVISAWVSQRWKVVALGAVMTFNVLQLYFYGNQSDLTVLYRYFLPFYTCTALLAGFGAANVWERWGRGLRDSVVCKVLLVLLVCAMSLAVPMWKWSDLSLSDSSYRFMCDYYRTLPAKTTVVWGGENQQFAATYGKVVKGWRHDIRFSFENAFTKELLPKTGEAIYSVIHDVQEPYIRRPWALLYRICDRETDALLPPPPPPYWMPPHFTQAELRDPEALGPLGNLYIAEAIWKADQKDMQGAYSSLENAAKLAPHVAYVFFKIAIQYDAWGDTGNAEKYLRKAVELQPQTYQALLNLGIIYGKLARYELCDEYLNRAAQVKPTDPVVHHYLAFLFQQTQGQFGKP